MTLFKGLIATVLSIALVLTVFWPLTAYSVTTPPQTSIAIPHRTHAVVPPPPPTTNNFEFTDFSSIAGLNLIGHASQFSNRLRLNPSALDQTGGAWYLTSQYVQGGFETTFQFQILDPGNTGADGFAFIVQNAGTAMLGFSGGSMGYGNIPNSLAVEFDTWDNDPGNQNGDPNGNHVSVHTNGTDPNSSWHIASLGSSTAIPDLSDGSVHTATVKYVPNSLQVFVDNPSTPALTVGVDLDATLNLDYGRAWVGFTAATAGSYESHDILSWSFTANRLPTAQNVTINPIAPDDDTDLTLTYTYSDADGDPEVSAATQLRWYRNDALQPALNDLSTTSAALTYAGEKWCATVRPYDGQDYGLATQSNCVIIAPGANQLPSVQNQAISPANPTTDDGLTLSYTYSDPESQPEGATELRWYRDGILQPAFNDLTTVPAQTTLPGEVWWATIRPHDGQDYGGVSGTAPVSIIESVKNTPPEVSDLRLSPSQPNDSDHLQLTYTFKDVDGDPEVNTKIYWYKNRIHQSTYDNLKIIPADATSAGDIWHAWVIPFDGQEFGLAMPISSVEILAAISNSAPYIANVLLAPEQPSSADPLYLRYDFFDPDDDQEGSTQIRWTSNGQPQTGYNDLTNIPASATSVGQTWCAAVTPHDGVQYGVSVSSNCVTILPAFVNTPPAANNVFLEPETPASESNLHIVYTFFDADGHAEQDSQIRWYKNNQLQSSLNDLTVVPGSETAAGQVWYATIKPHDGFELGTLQSTQVVTVNTPPQVGSVRIEPDLPAVGEPLVAVWQDYSDSNGDPMSRPLIRWYKNGIHQTALDDLTKLTFPNDIAGDTWQLEITPHDGIEYGATISSTTVVVQPGNPHIIYLPVIVKNEVVHCTASVYFEENDIDQAACMIAPNTTYVAYPNDLDDWYYFNLDRTSSVSIKVTNYQAVGQLVVYALDFNEDLQRKIVSHDGRLQPVMELPNSLKPNALRNLPPNKYFVRIYSSGNNTETTPYSLSFTVTPN